MKRIVLLFGLFLLQVLQQVYAQGCSQCKLLAEQGSEMDEASFGSNINWGILYLLIIPYVVLLFFFRKQIVSIFKGFRSK